MVFTGTVKDGQTGLAITGANVQVIDQNGNPQPIQTISGIDGTFSIITGLPNAKIQVTYLGYNPAISDGSNNTVSLLPAPGVTDQINNLSAFGSSPSSLSTPLKVVMVVVGITAIFLIFKAVRNGRK